MEDILFNGLKRGVPGQPGIAPDQTFVEPDLFIRHPKFHNRSGSLFLGVIHGTVHQSDDGMDRWVEDGQPIWFNDDRHIITIAGSRAGKGRGAIVPNLYGYTGSVLAIDPKGDLAHLTALRRSEQGQDVHVLDPFEVSGAEALQFRSAFNPMRMLDRMNKSIVPDSGVIADALVVSSGDQESHWDDSARNLIEGLILHVATHEKYEADRNLVKVYELLMKAEEESSRDVCWMEEEMRDSVEAGGAVRDAASDFYDRPDNERGSVLSTARRHMRFLSYPNVQEVLIDKPDQRSLESLKQLKTQKTTIYLSLPAMRMGTCFRWFRLFVNLTLMAMEEEKTQPEDKVLMILDEFAVLGHMKALEDAAGQIAGLGVKLWPILQDLGQLKALYRDRWETFLGNAGVLQFFGNSDMTTLDWISKRMGQTTVYNLSRNLKSPQDRVRQGNIGESISRHTEALMAPEEIAQVFARSDSLLRQLILIPGADPIILQRAFYDKHDYFSPVQ